MRGSRWVPAEAGGNAQAHLGLAEPGLFAGQSDVAGHAQLTAAAQGEAVYRRNHGLGQVLQLEEHAAAVHAELLAVDRGEALHLTDVGSRHKGAARAGQNHHIDLIVRRHLVDNRVQIAQNLAVQGVQGLLTVDRHDAHMALLFQLHKSHLFCLLNPISKPAIIIVIFLTQTFLISILLSTPTGK